MVLLKTEAEWTEVSKGQASLGGTFFSLESEARKVITLRALSNKITQRSRTLCQPGMHLAARGRDLSVVWLNPTGTRFSQVKGGGAAQPKEVGRDPASRSFLLLRLSLCPHGLRVAAAAPALRSASRPLGAWGRAVLAQPSWLSGREHGLRAVPLPTVPTTASWLALTEVYL